MHEHSEDGFIREINEELRQENFAKLWKRFGTVIIAAAVALVVSVGGYQGWRAYDLNSRKTQGERFSAAVKMAQAGDVDTAIKKLKELRAKGDSGYRMLSTFQDAGLLARKGDDDAAVVAYDQITNDTSYDSLYRDLARLLAATALINAAGDNKDITKRLQPLTEGENPWRYGARELLALTAERGGEVAKSRKLFKALSEDATAPQGIRQRAGEMLAALGG